MRHVLIMLFSALAEYAGLTMASRLGWPVARNSGVAFGLFGNSPAFATAASAAAFAALSWIALRMKGPCEGTRAALSVMAGGAAANLLSRLLSGAVTDWIPLPFSSSFIPGGLFFNLADAEIACGAAAALFCMTGMSRSVRTTDH